MTHQHDEDLRALEETALLPEDDPRRRELADRLEGATSERRDAWCAILAENEDLRLRLRGVEVPPGLPERVRRGCDGATARRRAFPLRRAAVAAAVLLVAVLAVLVVRSGRGPTASATYQLATLAAMDHAARPEMTVKTDDLDTLAEALGDGLPFDFNITRPEPAAILLGGRLCSFGDRPLVYTCWRIGAKEVALYQVRRTEFGLAARQSRREMDIPAHGSRESRCWTCVWTDAEFAYVMVRDQKSLAG
ncbi:MAG: hypothetical protein WD749_13345 [Phycisphaerales bacterium]